MRKYNNPRLLNTVVSGTGMQHPVKPHVIVSDTVSEFVKGDLMDANAISELVDQKIGSVEGSTEANVTELRLALAEETAARTSADQTLDERITDLSTSIPQAISDGIAQVVAGADADYDTLKEISDYIKSDKTGAAQLSTTVNNNTTAIDNETTRAQAKEAELEAAIDTKAAQSTTYTKAEVDTLVNSVDVSEQLANYYTKSEIDNAGYLTEHQDISNKADKSELFSGDYNDLTNKPTIPTVPTNVSEFTNDAGYLTQHQDISGKANTSDLAAVATSGSYNDLDDKPTIPTVPTNVSSFTNDANYQTQQLVDDRFTALINAAPAALDTLGEIATKLADNDDAVSAIVTSISDEVNAREAADTAITTNITELASTVSANNTAINDKVDALETSLEDRISDVEDTMPTKVSDLANDAGEILSNPKWQTIFEDWYGGGLNGPSHYGPTGVYFSNPLSSGTVYRVTINGVLYVKTAYLNDYNQGATLSDGQFKWLDLEGVSSIYTDNWIIYSNDNSNRYYYICLYFEDRSMIGQRMDVKIEKQIDTNNKIDSKYIPDAYVQDTDLQNLTNSLSTVATSGSYNDLTDKPTIPTNPTKLSELLNDMRYISSTNGYDYVEIGGIKWATKNVGATSETDIGLLFQWGDLLGYSIDLVGNGDGKKYFGATDYIMTDSYTQNGSYIYILSYTKYSNADGKRTLELSDDPANINIGSNWRMPTNSELLALEATTNYEWVSDYNNTGVTGVLLTDKTDDSKTLFLPSGYAQNGSRLRGVKYPSSEISTGSGVSAVWAINGSVNYSVYFGGSTPTSPGFTDRTFGCPIRAVFIGSDSLSTVAFSGSYNDLTNKPIIPTVPTKVSEFTNDAGYLTLHQSLDNYYTKAEVDSSQQAQNTEISSKADKSTTYTKTEVDNLIAPKANTSDVYSKTEADSTFIKEHLSLNEYAKKTELVDAYSKTETDELLANKANLADLAAANGHGYVDLGLPSGTLWATMNVGATSETDYGNYYMYGKGSETYVNPNTRYGGTEEPLATSADTATQEWGGAWHMPTSAQMDELKANTTYQWVTDYKGSGINGGLFTAANGKCVFFPAAGQWYMGNLGYVGEGCNYWSSSPSPSSKKNAYCMALTSYNKLITPSYDRMYGFSVRGVLNSKQLHRVAFSGDYNDLANKPVIPTVWAGTQAEYNAITSPSASTIYFIKG